MGDEEQAALPVAGVPGEVRLEDHVLEEDILEVRLQGRVDSGPRRTAEAVGADRVRGRDRGRSPGPVVADCAGHTGVVLGQFARRRVEAEVHVRVSVGPVVEDRLDVVLRRHHGHRGTAVGPDGVERRRGDPADLLARQAVEPAVVLGPVGAQAAVDHLLLHADFPHQLDGRCVQQAGPRVGAGAAPQVDDERPDAQPGQQQRAHQADRPAADDQHLRLDGLRAHFSTGCAGVPVGLRDNG